MPTITITVRYSSQAYSCRKGKVSASSTSSPEAAAQRLGERLYGAALQAVRKVGPGPNLLDEVWEIDAAPISPARGIA